MYIGPGARFGAAVGYVWNDSGDASVDAKFNSALAATWRAYAEAHGRPGIVVDAMILPESRSTRTRRRRPGRSRAIDRATCPRRTKRASRGSRRSIRPLDPLAHVRRGDEAGRRGRDGGRPEGVDRIDRDRAPRTRRLRRRGPVGHPRAPLPHEHEDGRQGDRGLQHRARSRRTQETRYGLKTKVRRMINNLRKTSRLADRYDYVMIHLNAQGISVQRHRRHRSPASTRSSRSSDSHARRQGATPCTHSVSHSSR